VKNLLPPLVVAVLGTFAIPAHPQEPAASLSAQASPATPGLRERHPHYEAAYERRVFHGSGGNEFAYGWLAPVHAEPSKRYPLVICLHGSGGSVKASAVLARPEMREKFPAFVMIGEAEEPYEWAENDPIEHPGASQKTPEKLPVLLEAVHALLQTEAIDRARIYITGQSLGGIGTWGAIVRAPELFAAAVPVCGEWNVADVPRMAAVPVWAFHGELDNTVPAHFSRDLTAAIIKAGGTAKYTEYPGVGHNSWLKAYEDMEMWEWLFAQHRAASPQLPLQRLRDP